MPDRLTGVANAILVLNVSCGALLLLSFFNSILYFFFFQI